ncbi:MAG: S8 family serine peptidase, partial [Actinobacteria bacterium]|nr:S8 family serine peptidase [Actinomycetota bacterium]
MTQIACATAANVGADPLEILSFTNGLGTDQFNLVIEHAAGPAPGRLKYVIFPTGSDPTITEFHTASGTIVGNKNAAGTAAVGAAFFGTPTVLESFSSAGSTPILFDTSGNLLGTPDARPSPSIVCADGGNNTFLGTDIAGDADTDPNFFGTSASAPHAAGIAALVLDMNGGLTPAALYQALELSAVDMDDPATEDDDDLGFDTGTGHGFCDAEAAVNLAKCGNGLPDSGEGCDDGNND